MKMRKVRSSIEPYRLRIFQTSCSKEVHSLLVVQKLHVSSPLEMVAKMSRAGLRSLVVLRIVSHCCQLETFHTEE